MSAGGPTAAGRRARLGAMTAVLLLAATVSLVIVNVLGARLASRVDVTATREHELSPRTVGLLEGLSGEYEIVVAAPLRDRSVVDPRALQRVADVLDKLGRVRGTGGEIRTTLIDTGSAAGLAAYGDLLKRLGERESEKVQKQTQTITASLAAIETLAEGLEALSPRLLAVRDAIPEESPGAATNRTYFEQRATEARLNARGLRDLAERSRKVLAAPLGAVPVPDLSAAADPLKQPVADVGAGMGDIADNLAKFAGAAGIAPAAADRARPLSAEAARLRDSALTVADGLERMGRLDLLRVAKALESASAAVVIGPKGLTAIELAQLFPPGVLIDASGGMQADLGRNAEELLGTAVAALAQPVKPIVVLIHGQPVRGFLKSPDFAGLLDRLALRGIDVVEWAASVDTEPPAFTALDPTGERPVVCVALATDSAANPPGVKGQSGPERAKQLGAALASVVESGEPLLLSLSPSTLPTFGEPDPIAAVLSAFGLEADTGRPLLRERTTPEGRQVDTAVVVRSSDGKHALLGPLRGLPTRLEWPIAIRPSADAGTKTRLWPLYRIEDKAVWGESQWLTYWQARGYDPSQIPVKPAPDAERDDRSGSWLVAAAVERDVPELEDPQRLVVVGSNTWFTDRIAQERVLVDGRPAASNPGNAELFEAAVYWLSGQDTMIAQSATARAAPLIGTLDPGVLLGLKWAAIAGLPGLVLLVGAVWRLARG